MIRHPYHGGHRRRPTRCSTSTLATSHLITIARLHDDCAKMRAVIDDIAAQVNDLDLRQPSVGCAERAILVIKRRLQEWKS